MLLLGLAAVAVSRGRRAAPGPGPGPRPNPAPSAPGELGPTVYPVEGPSKLLSRYGPGPKGFHYGVDISAPSGASVLACVNGTVTFGNDPKGGNVAILRSALDGTAYYYAHLLDLEASPPREVQAGDPIGHVGMSGNASATSPHLHFEVWPSGSYEKTPPDPTPFLQTARRVA